MDLVKRRLCPKLIQNEILSRGGGGGGAVGGWGGGSSEPPPAPFPPNLHPNPLWFYYNICTVSVLGVDVQK